MTWVTLAAVLVPLEFGLFGLVVLVVIRRFRGAVPTHSEMDPKNAWRQYYARFAVLVLAFVAFDMEMAYMYPWAVAFRSMGWTAFGDMLVFVAILSVALIYLWKTGALDLERYD